MKKIHRFNYSLDYNFETLEIVENNLINQILNVLKLNIGEVIILFDEKTLLEFYCMITDIDSNKIFLSILKKNKFHNKDFFINLYSCVLKKDNFEFVVQKTTECGIDNIFPLISERTIKTGINMDRLAKIAVESAEQCHRVSVPNVFDIQDLEKIKIDSMALNCVFDFSGNNVFKFLNDLKKESLKNINLFIGPEGGWGDKEMNFFKTNNFIFLNLGSNILRGETACIVSSWIFCNYLI